MEILSDYDCNIQYHAGKGNVVADALSRKYHEKPGKVRSLKLNLQIDLNDQIIEVQEPVRKEFGHSIRKEFGYHKKRIWIPDGIWRFHKKRIWIPKQRNLRHRILEEAHKSKYPIGIKKDIAAYDAKCLTCSQVKAEHQKPSGLLQHLEIPIWKWELITMDFVTKLPKTRKGNDTIWIIVDGLTKSAHFLLMKETFR